MNEERSQHQGKLTPAPSQDQWYINIRRNVLAVSEDRLRYHLLKAMPEREPATEWIAWLGVALTAFTALVSAEFHERLGIPKIFFQTFIVVFLIVATAMFCCKIIQARHATIISPEAQVEKIIHTIKEEAGDPIPLPPGVTPGSGGLVL